MLLNSSWWTQFRSTKAYDFLAALPLIFWYGLAVRSQLPFLKQQFEAIYFGTIDLKGVLQLSAVLSSALFFLFLIYLLVARKRPLLRSQGILPRFIAVLGTFLGTALLFLPVVNLSLGMLALSNILILGGSILAFFVALHLGSSFAIMPEARRLVTSGPYSVVRHPLYVVEAIIMLGAIFEFQQPWAFLIWVVVILLQLWRTVFEERILLKQYPEYAEYQQQTWRFIPGVY